MKSTTHFAIPYPEPADPPTISAHIKAIAENVDTTLWNYQQAMNSQMAAFTSSETAARTAFQTASQAQWAAWKGPMDARMLAIENALTQAGWGTPTQLTGALFTASAGYTALANPSATKVGNVCAFNIGFQKAADPAWVAGASGNISGAINIGTLSALMPKPSSNTPFTTMADGYQMMGYVNPSRQILVTALAPNVNFPKLTPQWIGGIYLFDPTVP